MDYWQEIRKKTRCELKEIAADFWTDSRIWLQENGEKAALVALVAGVLIVLTYPLIVWLLLIVGGLAGALWFTAVEGQTSTEKEPPEDHEMH